MSDTGRSMQDALETGTQAVDRALGDYDYAPTTEEVGRVIAVGEGIAWAEGLGAVGSGELVKLAGRVSALVMDILPDKVGLALLDDATGLSAGDEAVRTERVLDVPVGAGLVGRVVDPLGRPLDGGGPVDAPARWPVERAAPPIMHRAPVERPVETGITVIDALIPVGRGQRELILGDRQTGKTDVALTTILNQQGKDCLCVYCAVGQRSSSVASAVETLRQNGALEYTMVVVAEGGDQPGMIYAAPFAATSMAEYLMHEGRDVLVVYDDLTRHAVAYRQLSLLLRRPPGREAFPGDIFYLHSRLLERATHLRDEHGGGSLTALPVIETEAQNLSAYIPTNLISITDGQIYVNPDLFRKGQLPAVDVGKSVSRVGGRAQHPGYRKVAGDLRLSYSQFQELEAFARFGTRLDESTRKTLEHGRRVREAFKQRRYERLSAPEQVSLLFAVTSGFLDTIPVENLPDVRKRLTQTLEPREDLMEQLTQAGPDDGVWEELQGEMERFFAAEGGDDNP